MHEYLMFPPQNWVGRKMSSTKYINAANQTKAESKWLEAHLGSIEILYSFPYCDGEIVVLLADYSSVEHRKYSLNNFVLAVAQSVPYRILLIVRNEGAIRFFAFNEKTNTINGGRSRVLAVSSSTDIIPLADDIRDNMLIEKLREAAYMAETAEELNRRWYSAFSSYEDSPNAVIVDTFDYTSQEYRKLHEQRLTFDKIAIDQLKDAVDECVDLFEGEPLDIEEEVDHRLFVEFCAYYAYELFEQAKNSGITEEKWLHLYMDRCNAFAKNVFNRVLCPQCVLLISDAYWHDNGEYEEAADSYNVDDLKDLIGDYFDE